MITLLAQVSAEELADIRKPIEFVQWLYVGIGAAVFFIALIVLFVALRKRRKKMATMPVEPPIPPVIWAREQFDRLAAESTRLDDKAYTSGVADVLRTYLERAFEVPAPESTTEEFLQLIGKHPIFAGKRETLDTFLHRCDLVKFARQALDAAQRQPVLEEARAVVEEAEAQRTPAVLAATGGAAQ